MRPRVLLYSVDRSNSSVAQNDARINDLYVFLLKNKISYIEFFHAVLDRGVMVRWWARKRRAFYLRSLDFLLETLVSCGFIDKKEIDESQLDLSGFSSKEVTIVRPIILKYLTLLPLVEFKVRLLTRFLRWLNPQVIWGIDNTRDYHELVVAAENNQVPFLAFQHGHFTKYHVGWLDDGTFTGKIARPKALYVWSEYWKKELLRLGTYFEPHEIIVGGTKSPPFFTQDKVENHDTTILNILVPYEGDSVKHEVKKYLDALLEGGCRVYFKVRTDVARTTQLLDMGLTENYHGNFHIIENAQAVMGQVDIVAGTYSTYLYDMIMFEKPVVLLKTSNDFGEGLVTNGLAEEVTLGPNLLSHLAAIRKIEKSVLRGRRDKLYDKEPQKLLSTLQLLGEQYRLIDNDAGH